MQTSRVRICLLLAGIALSPLAFGQTVFLAGEDKAAPKVVKGVSMGRPLVEIDGKTQVGYATRYIFGHALAYRPGLVTLTNFRIKNRHLVNNQTGAQLNYELLLSGSATADVELKDCFLVLEIDAWKTSAVVFKEVHDLAPGKSVDLEHTFKLDRPLVEGRYRLYIYSAGREVLHSRMAPGYIEAQREKTNALLAGKNQDFPPFVAHRLPPVYPEDIKGPKPSGSAEVKCLVTARGEVKSVELVSATNPAFGPAAVAAVSGWKFDPAVKGRQFADAETVVSVQFRAPK